MTETELRVLLPLQLELIKYMDANGGHDGHGKYPAWYVGLTDDLSRRRDEHGNPSHWYGVPTPSFAVAKSLKSIFYEQLTLKSEDRGGNDKSVYVYVFKLTDQTKPTLKEASEMEFAKDLVDPGK